MKWLLFLLFAVFAISCSREGQCRMTCDCYQYFLDGSPDSGYVVIDTAYNIDTVYSIDNMKQEPCYAQATRSIDTIIPVQILDCGCNPSWSGF